MSVRYLDPYKDDKYGKLRGDKSDDYFGVVFDEAVVHKTEDAYIIAGNVTKYTSVVRNYKPELPLNPGLCAVPIYGKEYEIRRKDRDGNWTSDKIEPSLFEKALYLAINEDEDNWMPFGAGISLALKHLPNDILEDKGEDGFIDLMKSNVTVGQVDLSGKLPDYTPPSNNYQRKGNGKSWGVSPDEKLAFLKRVVAEDIKDPEIKKSTCLGDLIDQLILEHKGDEQFLSIYMDFVAACVR